ncbi:signal peptidase I [Enterococcus sp. AZ194]|uniref:signal peptidase I n=1 Tax=Enterococcus sp. AZ194 TaxID=2774629 RepID=UPI003F68751F
MKENKQEERMSRPQHKKKRRRKQHTVQPKKRGPKKRRQKKRVVYVWWSIGLLASLFGFFLWVFYVSYTVHPVVGTSMDPAVKDGATVLLAKEEPFIRYDVIGFSVKGEDNHFVKRIIGLPGDPIFVAGNRLVIDLEGEGAFTTTYSVTLTETLAKAWQDQTRIPNDCYFVLGDHLQVSKDSRSFGWVKRSSIKGRVQWIQN